MQYYYIVNFVHNNEIKSSWSIGIVRLCVAYHKEEEIEQFIDKFSLKEDNYVLYYYKIIGTFLKMYFFMFVNLISSLLLSNTNNQKFNFSSSQENAKRTFENMYALVYLPNISFMKFSDRVGLKYSKICVL